MNKLSLASIVTLAVAATGAADIHHAAAQTADAQRIQQLEKENTAMRGRIRRLELEKENLALRAQLNRLQGGGQGQPVQPLPAAPAPSGATVAAAPMAINGVPQAVPNTLYDADLPVYKAVPPVAYYSWTGFYIGANVGYSVGNDRGSASLSEPGAGVLLTSGADEVVAPNGVIGGGQLGYNWQGGPHWLFGVEADFQGSQQSDTSCVLECTNTPTTLLTLTDQHQLEYFGTVRGRVGYVNNDTLFYATAGGAYGRVDQTVSATAQSGGTGTFSSATTSQNKFGFAVGGGVETALWGGWSGKIEYLYIDLGSVSAAVPGNLPPAPLTPFMLSASSTVRDNIIRVGLNYRFGAQPPQGAVYDAYTPVPGPSAGATYAWTGPYVGANVGYGFGNDPTSETETVGGAFSGFANSTTNAAFAPNGLIGGAQIGYNWQGGRNWLVGVEADFQGTSQTDTACGPLVCFNAITAASSSTNIITVQQQLDYFGTLRGRLGVVNNDILYYGTGGAAFGHATETVGVNSSLSTPAIFASNSSTADLIGYAVGGGIEAALSGGWSAKVEYLYMDLGSIGNTVNIGTPGTPANITTNSSIHDNIVRIGANYHL
jgi:outer membrane immunogenic protein